MKVRNIALFIVAAALALPVLAAPMKPGKWQITAQMSMAGMDMKMPANTFERCITPEEAEKPQPPKQRNDDCKVEDYKLDGNTLTYKINCAKTGATGEGKITFNNDSYEGGLHLTTQGRDVTVTYTAKRLGDCDK
jgi:hypothetical protein